MSSDESYWLAKTITETTQGTATDLIDRQALVEVVYETLSNFDATAALQYGARHGVVRNTAQKPKRGRPRTTRRGI